MMRGTNEPVEMRNPFTLFVYSWWNINHGIVSICPAKKSRPVVKKSDAKETRKRLVFIWTTPYNHLAHSKSQAAFWCSYMMKKAAAEIPATMQTLTPIVMPVPTSSFFWEIALFCQAAYRSWIIWWAVLHTITAVKTRNRITSSFISFTILFMERVKVTDQSRRLTVHGLKLFYGFVPKGAVSKQRQLKLVQAAGQLCLLNRV